MSYSHTCDVDPAAVDALDGEVERQRNTLAMIASGSHVNETVFEAQRSALTDKYVEGYPGRHYHTGCEYTDDVGTFTVGRAEELWGVEHTNVQPHSGTQANMGVYLAVLDPGDKIFSLDPTHGGHLSHDHPANFASKLYDAEQYEVDAETGHIDCDQLVERAVVFEPDIIVSDYSVYPRVVEWKMIQEVADDVDAFHLADITHIMDFVAVGIHPSPVGVTDLVTGSTYRTVRADRGGVIMCDGKYASDIDGAVLPGAQGGPFIYNIAGKAVGLREALQPESEEYAQQVIDNVKVLTEMLEDHGLSVASGNTDMYLILIDPRDSRPDLTGDTAEEALKPTGTVLNVNTVLGGAHSAFNPSGIYAGTPGPITHGFGEDEIRKVDELITEVVDTPEDDDVLAEVSERVQGLYDANPLYE